ncbi:MAG TPA: DUF885 domain-containing protein [Acidimicrobiales bacterium]|nr:DUF885 domain-containing protein [Acidimicrobiales bacterium]
MSYGQDLAEVTASAGLQGARHRLHRLFDVVWEHLMADRPDAATFLGWPKGGDRLPDLSLAAVARRRAEAGVPLEVLASIDRGELDAADQLSYDVFASLHSSEAAGAAFPGDLLAVTQLAGPQNDLALLFGAMPTTTPAQRQDLVARLRAVPALVDQTIELLGEGRRLGITPPRVTLRHVPAQVAAQVVDAGASPLLAPLRRLPASVPAAEAAGLRAEAEAVFSAEVAPAFARLHTVLVDEYLPAARESTALAALPDGPAWYDHLVRHHTTTDLTAAEVHDLGVAEVARIGAEMTRVQASTDYQGPPEGFAEHLRGDRRFSFATEAGLLTAYRDIAKRIDPEIVRLFGRLPRLPFGIVAVPAEMAPSAPAAFYLEGSTALARPGRFFANTYDLASRPSWNMESLCLHEAVPGHHFQITLAQELHDLPEFRRRGLFTAFVEGWGLYCESLGPELGLYQDPYQRFGALDAEMLRAIRLVVDTGMHALGWSRERAIAYFSENSVTPAHDIVVEVDRYLVMPGQALAYKVGERKLAELRRRAENRLGPAFDIRAFHDQLLAQGALPLDVLERLMDAWIDRGAAPAATPAAPSSA